MVTVVHATLRKNLASIRKYGLQPKRATGKLKAVWFAPESMDGWAVEHVMANRAGRIDDLVVITVEVPGDWLKGHRHGLFKCFRTIPPSMFRKFERWEKIVEVLR